MLKTTFVTYTGYIPPIKVEGKLKNMCRRMRPQARFLVAYNNTTATNYIRKESNILKAVCPEEQLSVPADTVQSNNSDTGQQY
jgi:hypothetical protein